MHRQKERNGNKCNTYGPSCNFWLRTKLTIAATCTKLTTIATECVRRTAWRSSRGTNSEPSNKYVRIHFRVFFAIAHRDLLFSVTYIIDLKYDNQILLWETPIFLKYFLSIF